MLENLLNRWKNYRYPDSHQMMLNNYYVFYRSWESSQGEITRETFQIIEAIERDAQRLTNKYKRTVATSTIADVAGMAIFAAGVYVDLRGHELAIKLQSTAAHLGIPAQSLIENTHLALIGLGSATIFAGIEHTIRSFSLYTEIMDIKNEITNKIKPSAK